MSEPRLQRLKDRAVFAVDGQNLTAALSGKPIHQAYISIEGWNRRKALHNHDHPNVHDTKIPRRTDSNGGKARGPPT